MTSGQAGSTYRPHSTTEIRLARWRRLASTGMSRADIAAELSMTLVALDQALSRARKHGHRDAIYHPTTVLPGEGLGHLRNGSIRARRIRRAQETR